MTKSNSLHNWLSQSHTRLWDLMEHIGTQLLIVQVKATESPGTMRISLGASLAPSQRGTAPSVAASVKSTMEKGASKTATRPMGATLPASVAAAAFAAPAAAIAAPAAAFADHVLHEHCFVTVVPVVISTGVSTTVVVAAKQTPCPWRQEHDGEDYSICQVCKTSSRLLVLLKVVLCMIVQFSCEPPVCCCCQRGTAQCSPEGLNADCAELQYSRSVRRCCCCCSCCRCCCCCAISYVAMHNCYATDHAVLMTHRQSGKLI